MKSSPPRKYYPRGNLNNGLLSTSVPLVRVCVCARARAHELFIYLFYLFICMPFLDAEVAAPHLIQGGSWTKEEDWALQLALSDHLVARSRGQHFPKLVDWGEQEWGVIASQSAAHMYHRSRRGGAQVPITMHIIIE